MMKMRAGDKLSLDVRLGGYLAAVGATFAVSPPVEATIISYAGPWTRTGADTTLVSFNLAGVVATDGTHVADEQFFFGNQTGTNTKQDPLGKTHRYGTNRLFLQGQGAAAVAGDPNGVLPLPATANTYGQVVQMMVARSGIGLLLSSTLNLPTFKGGPVPPGTFIPSGQAPFGGSGLLLSAAINNQTLQLPATFCQKLPIGTCPATLFPATFPLEGSFRPGQQAFLGLHFDGPGDQIFPGWAEVRVNSSDSITLLAYAYEDTGAPIAIGDRGAVSPPAVPEPGTLSLLALGASGLAVLRRRRKAQQPAERDAQADA